MANTVDMHLNIHNSLNRDMKKTLKYADSFNDKLSRSEFATKGLSKGFSGINGIINSTNGALTKMTRTARQLVPALGAIFGGGLIIQSTRNVIKYSQSFRELSHQMGDGASSTKVYSEAMVNAALSTGLATEDIGDLIIGLKGLRVPLNNMEEAAVVTARFSEATGVGSDASARLFGEMMRTGRMSQKMATQTMASMALIQKEFGLTNSELEDISSNIISVTQSMNLLGKSSSEAKKMAGGATALAIVFSRVGIEASEALDIVNDLLNPERVQDNAFLYAKLGISMNDAFEGNVDIVGQMIPRVSELGKQMQNMSGPAAAAMARSLGLPLNTLRQFGEINLGFEEQRELAKLMGEEGLTAGEALAAMQSETRGLDKVMSAVSNTIQTIISKGAEILGRQFEGMGDSLRGFDKSDAFKKIGEVMENAASSLANFVSNSGGLEGIIEKVASGFGKIASFITQAPKLIPLIGIGLFLVFKKVRKKLYSATTGAVKDMTDELKIAVNGVYDMMEKKSSSINIGKARPRNEVDKPGAFSVESIARRNKTRTQGNILEVSFSEKQLELAVEKKRVLKDERTLIKERLDYLLKTNETQGLSHRQSSEMNNLMGISLEKTREARLMNSEIQQINERMTANKIREFNFATTPSLEALFLETKTRRENLISQQKALDITTKSSAYELDTNKKLINLMQEEAAIAISSGRGEDAARILEKVKDQESIQVRLNAAIAEQVLQQANITKEMDEQKDISTRIEETYRKRTGAEIDQRAPAEMKVHGLMARVMETTGQVYGNMIVGISRASDNIKDSFHFIVDSTKNTVKGFLEKMRDKPVEMLYAGAKKTISGTVQTVGKVMNSSVGRLIGPMALLGVAMKLLQPIMKAISPAIEQLTGIFQNVLIKILKAIGPPILNVLAALMPLMASLVNTALPPLVIVLGYLLKVLSTLVQGVNYILIGINNMIGVSGKLDGAIVAMSEISESFLQGSIDTINAGKEMWENKVLDASAVKSLQDTLTGVAKQFASGEIVLTTKDQDTADKFGGAGISLDPQGRIRISNPAPTTPEISQETLNQFKRSPGVSFNSGSVNTETQKGNLGNLKIPLGVAENFTNMGVGLLNGIVSVISSRLLPSMEKPKKISKANFTDWIDEYERPEQITPNKKTPKAVTSFVTRNNAMELYQNKLVLEALEKIANGIDSISAHEQMSVDELRAIAGSSQKTATQVGRSTRGSFAELRKQM